MLVWGEADSETSPKKESRRKACKDMLHDLRGEVIQLMITTMVPRTSQDKEEQAGGTSFKELERQKTHLQALDNNTSPVGSRVEKRTLGCRGLRKKCQPVGILSQENTTPQLSFQPDFDKVMTVIYMDLKHNIPVGRCIPASVVGLARLALGLVEGQDNIIPTYILLPVEMLPVFLVKSVRDFSTMPLRAVFLESGYTCDGCSGSTNPSGLTNIDNFIQFAVEEGGFHVHLEETLLIPRCQ
ncbi:hypothetical protein Tco_0468393 [Tanacetum coccineum]